MMPRPEPPAVAWAPARLTTSGPVPRELRELAQQLERVEHQRQQLLLKAASSPASPVRQSASHQRRPSSPAILAPLGTSPASPRVRSTLGLAPAPAVSDVVVCDVCKAELASAALLRTHKASCCRMRRVVCPRAGCGVAFLAHERSAHDREDCVATRRTQQLLDDHALAHTLVPCSVCGDLAATRGMDDHKLLVCVKREVACRYEPSGCHARFPLDQRELHETTSCRIARHRARVRAAAATVNEQLACDWCGQQVLKRRLLDHQEEECPKRERPCPHAVNGCPEWVPVDSVARHLTTTCIVTRERDAMAAHAKAMNTLVTCCECGGSVKRRYLAAHGARECVGRIVNCKNVAHGCNARLRWRDRHLHEDFLALASRDRSMLQFPVGGRAYVVLQSETSAQLERRGVDLPPPWTLELFLWLVDAREEILDLHARALELVETVVVKQRELERFTQQSKACKKKLKELKRVRKPDANDTRSNSQLLGDVAVAAKTLADEFHTADTGVTETAQAIALARGGIQLLVTDAYRLLQDEQHRDSETAVQIQRDVETQALARMASRELLSAEFLNEDELLRLGDLDRWAASVAPASNASDRAATAERQQRATEQRKLVDKRAALTQTMEELEAQEAQGEVDAAEAARLRRRHERERTKLEAKLALVSDSTPTALLDRKGRHVIASSARNAIVLCGGAHGRVTYVRSVAGTNPRLAPRGDVDFQVALERNRWHHVAFCASAHEMTLIVDGHVKSVTRGVFELPFARLGSNDATAAESFQGFLQEVRVWKSCLTKDYLAANASQIVHVPRHAGELVAYYTLEEGGGDTLDDLALVQPRAACVGTQWVLYNTAAIRQKFGSPPTPSFRDKTSCVVHQRLQLLAQRARDRETEPLACRLHCGVRLPLRTLERHQRVECANRMVVCLEVGCEQTFRWSDRERHFATQCERRLYREALVRQHVDRETLEPCLLRCGATIKRRAMEKHYTRECGNRLVACPQSDCGESIVAKGLTRHLAVDCKSAELVAERKMVENARRRQQENKQT